MMLLRSLVTQQPILSVLHDIELAIITYLSVHGPTDVTVLNYHIMGKEPDLYGRFASVLMKLRDEGVIENDSQDTISLTNRTEETTRC